MNLTIEMRERLKAVAVETAQLQADIAALGGTPIEPEKRPDPPLIKARTGATAGEKAAGGDALKVKEEPAGRGKRKSKGRKR